MNYFEDPSSKRFSFSSEAMGLTEETFAVIQFKGYEALSKPYDFEILLVSSIIDIDLGDVLQASAVFTIHRGENDDVIYNGIMAEFEQLNEFNGYVYYKARLVPKLWWLNLTKHNQVFLEQTVPEFAELALHDGGLEAGDFSFSGLEYGYETMEYVCQYSESHYYFLSRWMEREGIYYYFSQEPGGEQVMFTDSSFAHEPLNQGADLYYSPPSGLESTHLTEVIHNLTCRQKQLPAEVVLKDHNYERPSLNNEGRADVDPQGRGVSYVYGEHFATPEEGLRLAAIRAEELLCQKQEFYGESTVPFMGPGYKFNLLQHYREDFNNEYLITEVTHEGYQTSLLSSGISGGISDINSKNTYINSFKAIPGDVQFRPEVKTDKPKISGTLHAVIDGEVDSEYAQLDEEGRYKVRLPFDVNDEHMDGRASARVRMIQPYAGENRGMQFPMSKGTEVLLTFVAGNPDRPLIAGAVNNPSAPGPVGADNQTESVIQTGGNNKIRMEDKSGSERIVMQSPMANSWIRVGAHNDPITLNGSADEHVLLGASWTDQGAFSTDPADPLTTAATITGPGGATSVDTDTPGIYQLTYTSANVSGSNDTAIRNVVVYDPNGAVVDSKPGNGIRIRSAGDLWLEAQGKYGEYHSGRPTTASTDVKTMLDKFGAVDGYSPTGLLDYGADPVLPAWDAAGAATTDAKNVVSTISNAHVKVSSLDTFNTQEGNIYDFGGYWNYNLGNGYAEEHISQSPKLNMQGKYAWPVSSAANAAKTAENIGILAVSAIVTGGTVGAAGGPVGAVIGIAAFAALGAAFMGLGVFSSLTMRPTFPGDNIGDIMTGGPNTGAIKSWAFDDSFFYSVGSSFADVDDTTGKPTTAGDKLLQTDDPTKEDPNNGKKPMHTDTTWVTKQYGDAYTYNRGNDISVRVGNTEEHNHGSTVEYNYGGGSKEEANFTSSGKLSSWTRKKSGNTQEVNFDNDLGTPLSYTYKRRGYFTFNADLGLKPTITASLSLTSGVTDIKFCAGTSLSVKVSAGIDTTVEAHAGLAIKASWAVGGELVSESGGKFEFKAVGMAAKKEAELKAQKLNTQLIQGMMKVAKTEVNLAKSGIKVNSCELYADTSAFKFF